MLLFIMIFLGATYAYFQAQYAKEAQTTINISSGTTDSLTFMTDKPINISVNQSNFNKNSQNLYDKTIATASLLANNETNTASLTYNVYIQLDENELVYTTEDRTPELVVSIKNPSGEYLQNLGDYVKTNIIYDDKEIPAFDMTGVKGLIPIVEGYEIFSNSTEMVKQDWEIIFTFINLNTNQYENTSKNISGKVIIQKDLLKNPTLAYYVKNLYKSDGINNLYYHDGLGDYENVTLEANDKSYRYVGGDYQLTSKSKELGYNSIYDILILSCGNNSQKNNYLCNTSTYYFYNVYKDDIHYQNLSEALKQAITDGYIIKNEVNNYVCFGNKSNCEFNNLYRIIGVFNEQGEYLVKLIKADMANSDMLGKDGTYYAEENHWSTYIGNSDKSYRYIWNKKEALADWASTELNTVNLNTNYLQYITDLDGDWENKIYAMNWQAGGMDYQYGHESNALNAYKYELGELQANSKIVENTKIGLMYVTDYYYATLPIYWSKKGGFDWSIGDKTMENGDYRLAIWDNWIWSGDHILTMTPQTKGGLTTAYNVDYGGGMASGNVKGTTSISVIKPVFYLNSNVEYVSGSGRVTDPFIIN